MANIKEAINQATDAAASMAAQHTEETQGAIVEAYTPQGGAPTTFAKPSLATVAATTGVIPRSTPYIKVNEDGIKIGKDKTYLDGFEGKILMVEDEGFQLKWTIRFGNPAQYLSTYDGAICDKGGSWNDALRKAKAIDPAAEPYHSVDIVIELTKDVKLKDEVLKAGTKIGINTSKSNFSEFQDFVAEVNKKGLMGETVDVKFGHREINHNGNTWGVVTFELL